MKKMFEAYLSLFLCVILAAGCDAGDYDLQGDRKEFDKVLLYMGLANNNLGVNIEKNLKTLAMSDIPLAFGNKAFLAYVHIKGDPFSPALVRFKSGWDGETVCDTLKRWPAGTVSTSETTISEVIDYVGENFKSDHYGLVLSSHGTGWLPEGYYNSGEKAVPTSFGSEKNGSETVELSITGLRHSLEKMHFDYIVFDACLMGGVETAYELKDICDYVIASSAEILDEGMDYKTLTRCFLSEGDYLFEEYCDSYVDMYRHNGGDDEPWRFSESATISVTDCSGLDNLAEVCKNIFDKHRETLMHSLDGNLVQGFFRYGHHWFYDLEDILVKVPVTEAERASLQNALKGCVIAKGCTERLFEDIEVKAFCGLTMYLPSMGSGTLNGFYSTLAWNKATRLVIL